MSVTVTRFDRESLTAMCKKLGPMVGPLPAGIDGAQLLWSLTGNESSYGSDCVPRHETGYDQGGHYASNPQQARLLATWGSAGACSYGPLQVMLVNAPDGYTPADFNDLEKGMRGGIYELCRLLAHFKPETVEEIGYCYNGGHEANPTPAALSYGARLAKRYQTTPIGEVLPVRGI